jgi:fatty-acid peroxygenase
MRIAATNQFFCAVLVALLRADRPLAVRRSPTTGTIRRIAPLATMRHVSSEEAAKSEAADASALPRAPHHDSSLALLSRGYRFVGDTGRELGTDAFTCRLMLTRAVCAFGAEAAHMFYAPGRFTRVGGVPRHTLRMLQGQGSVQTLDGSAHARRKKMFLSVMTADAIGRLCALVEEAWAAKLAVWRLRSRIELLPEAEEILCRAVCAWAGIPLGEADIAPRTREIAAAIDGAGSFGPRALRGLWLRNRTDRWLGGVVDGLRDAAGGRTDATPAGVVASHRDADDRPLDRDIAAIELCNLIRPTVAIARYVVFIAMALQAHPDVQRRLREGEPAYAEAFVQEVRRLYPFLPLIGGRALKPFSWRGHRFEAGDWMLLDLYGTNHDDRSWTDAGSFRPERFLGWPGDPYTLIPQGGGDHAHGHRCAGEWITIAVMTTVLRLLLERTRYDVPLQDMRIDLDRIPARPRSGFVMSDVRPAAA